MKVTDQRALIDALIGEGKPTDAARELARLWARDSSSAGFVVSRFQRVSDSLPLLRCSVSIERSFTLEPLISAFRAAAYANGIDLSLRLSPFNAYAQEMLDPKSALYDFQPDIVVVAALTSDLAPDLWNGFPVLAQAEIVNLEQEIITRFQSLIDAFRAHSAANIIVHLLERPAFPSAGVLDSQCDASQLAAIQQINTNLKSLARTYRGVYCLDYDALIARFGTLNWRDEGKWQSVRMPIRAQFHPALIDEWMRFLIPLTGKSAKVVAVDLDNTLWGGVIGEDGIAGIQLGGEYPGTIYKSVQQALLALRERGLLLAICSKNNEADVHEVFEKHPEMVLKLEHFAAIRVNWDDKVSSLRSIAAELNVGLDSLAFLDDNKVERDHVQQHLPEVHVIELPDDPLRYADAIISYPFFARLALSNEDQQRSAAYAARSRVSELKENAESWEDFLRSLQQKVIIEDVNDLTLARVAQLTQKTNQFNLTTRRYTEQDIDDLRFRPDWRFYTLRVIDRYVDNGFVGLAMVRDLGESWSIETFLLSCRVIGRGVETALLSAIVNDARAAGKHSLVGRFIATAKNMPAKDFYLRHGFALLEELPSQTSWQLELATKDITNPIWIERLSREAISR